MPLTSQKQVMAGLGMKAGRAVRQLATQHDRTIVAPIRGAIGKAKSNEDLLRRLGKSLFRRMDASGLAEAMADDMVTSGLIGRATAMPKEATEGAPQRTPRNVNMPKRSDEGHGR